ncbi:MAG: right-handed parallel beta-helix repeat-containing protein [Prevotella sp.]|nr:right-handed parallel beta-helix repeat-containing protein [Prevotella sp.]
MKKSTFFVAFCLLLAVCGASAQTVYNVMDFGARGDGITDDAQALQQAIDRCTEEGGGRVLLPRMRTFLCGPVELKSNVELHIESTATLLCNPDESIYQQSAFGENRGEGMMWLWARNARNLSITGRGTIHGNGIRFMGQELSDSYELKPLADPTFDPRPHVLTLIACDNLLIRDVTIREGAYWTVHLVGCNVALIDGINLLNDLKIRNGDGIDLDHSKNVRISNCHITSGDDCICLKNRREFAEYGACHDIVVTNCTLASRSCAIKIGSENMDNIYNVLVTNCIITQSNRGIGIQNRDEGTVTDVTFSNIMMDLQLWSDVWWGKAEPIYVTSYPRADGNHKDANWRFPHGETQGRCGAVSRITFQNIQATSENGCFIGGDTPDKVSDITLQNVTLNLRRTTTYANGLYDRRPCRDEGFVTAGVFGVYIEQAQNVGIEQLTVNNYLSAYEGKVHYPTNTSNPVHRFRNFINRAGAALAP